MNGMKELGVRIYREWHEMIKPLTDAQPKKGLRFFTDCIKYTLGITDVPDFSDDPELQELWERTNARPCNQEAGKEGWLKVWKRKRGAI